MNDFVRIENAAHAGAFGVNGTPTPTDAQCIAGNYKVGRLGLFGMQIAIEQPRGTYRTGTDAKTGKRWATRLAAHYGYINGSVGNDGDAVDCFIGAYPQADTAFVVNQNVGGRFDEHKVMLCFPDEESARRAYLDSYERGWNGLASIARASIPQLKWWLKHGDMRRPLRAETLPPEGLETMTRNTQWSDDAHPVGQSVDQVLYDIRRSDAGQNLLLDAVTALDIIEDAGGVLVFDALVTPFGKLGRKMEVLRGVMERIGGTVKPVAVQTTEPFKQRGVANVAAIFELSDGQTVSIYFHNPDVTPNKMAAGDELISWKWLLNKKDVTIVVAPERGEDLNVREVARRIIRLAEKNSQAFQRANTQRADRMQRIDGLKSEIAGLEKDLAAAQNELQVATLAAEERAAGPKREPAEAPGTPPADVMPDGLFSSAGATAKAAWDAAIAANADKSHDQRFFFGMDAMLKALPITRENKAVEAAFRLLVNPHVFGALPQGLSFAEAVERIKQVAAASVDTMNNEQPTEPSRAPVSTGEYQSAAGAIREQINGLASSATRGLVAIQEGLFTAPDAALSQAYEAALARLEAAANEYSAIAAKKEIDALQKAEAEQSARYSRFDPSDIKMPTAVQLGAKTLVGPGVSQISTNQDGEGWSNGYLLDLGEMPAFVKKVTNEVFGDGPLRSVSFARVINAVTGCKVRVAPLAQYQAEHADTSSTAAIKKGAKLVVDAVVLASDDGGTQTAVMLNRRYYAYFVKRYQGAEFFADQSTPYVAVRLGGKLVGAVAPIHGRGKGDVLRLAKAAAGEASPTPATPVPPTVVIDDTAIAAYVGAYQSAAARLDLAVKGVDLRKVVDAHTQTAALEQLRSEFRVANEMRAAGAKALELAGINPNDSRVESVLRGSGALKVWSDAMDGCEDMLKSIQDAARDATRVRAAKMYADLPPDAPIADAAKLIFQKRGILLGELPTALQDFLTAIAEKNVDRVWSTLLNNDNLASAEVFTRATGIALSRTMRDRRRQIDAWAGITEQQRKDIDAGRDAAAAERKVTANLDSSWQALAAIGMAGGSTLQDWIKTEFTKGFTDVGTKARGAATQYGLSDGSQIQYVQKSKTANAFFKAALAAGGLRKALEMLGVDIPPAAPAAPDEEDEAGLAAWTDLQYRFENATQAFKAWLSESTAKTEYSPFATARAMDQAAKTHGATVEWDFFSPEATFDSATGEADTEADSAISEDEFGTEADVGWEFAENGDQQQGLVFDAVGNKDAGFLSVSYAYPGSENAAKVSRARTGAWCVEFHAAKSSPGNATKGFDTAQDAVAYGRKLGLPWLPAFVAYVARNPDQYGGIKPSDLEGQVLDSALGDEEDEFCADDEWECMPSVDADEVALDGDFKGHPFRGNQYRKASRESGAAVHASMRAKRAELRGSKRERREAHTAAHHMHQAASITSRTKAAKRYHATMARFHAGRAGVALDSVALDRSENDGDQYVGKIRRDGSIVGRIDIGDDGKAMVYVGAAGDARVVFPSGTRAMYSDDDAVLMVDALFSMRDAAAPAPAAKSTGTEYRYALVYRPAGMGATPAEGFLRVDPAPADIASVARHGVAVYSRELTEQELKQFELRRVHTEAERAAAAEAIAQHFAGHKYADNYYEYVKEGDMAMLEEAMRQELWKQYPFDAFPDAEAMPKESGARFAVLMQEKAVQSDGRITVDGYTYEMDTADGFMVTFVAPETVRGLKMWASEEDAINAKIQDAINLAKSSPYLTKRWNSKRGEVTHVALSHMPTMGAGSETYDVVYSDGSVMRIKGGDFDKTMQKEAYEATPEGAAAIAAERAQRDAAAAEAQSRREAAEKAAAARKQDLDSQIDDWLSKTSYTPVQKGSARAILSREAIYPEFDNAQLARVEFVQRVVDKGGKPNVEQVNRIKDKTRTQWNRMSNEEQREHERKVREGGKVPEYSLGNYIVTKTEYDYANFLIGKKSAPEPEVTPEQTTPAANPDRALFQSVIDGTVADILAPELADDLEAAYTRNQDDAELLALFEKAVEAYQNAMMAATANLA
ncbi:MAG: hypothetical protein JNM98_18675 [Rhodocyclaceae bacterium]|nr:hypothetical protein [Rhodocyclaceae bacterium]